ELRIARQAPKDRFDPRFVSLKAAKTAQQHLDDLIAKRIGDEDSDLLITPAELAHMLAVEAPPRGNWRRRRGVGRVHMPLPSVVQTQQVAIDVVILDLLEQRAHQRRLPGALHAPYEFSIKLVDPMPALCIALDAFLEAGHAACRL